MPKSQQNQKHMRSTLKSQQSWRQKRSLLIIISTALVIIIAAVSIAAWINSAEDKPYDQEAIRVSDETFNTRYYINMMKIYYGNVPPQALYDYLEYGDLEIQQFAGYVEQQIVQNEVIRQGSAALGVQIERSAIEAELKNSLLPATREHIDILMAQQLMEKQVPSKQPQANVQAILVESETAAEEVKARLLAGESFEEVAIELSRIPLSRLISNDLGWITAREADLIIGSTQFGDIIFNANVGLGGPSYDDTVTKQFGYWVIKVVEKKDATETTPASIRIQGVLVGSEDEANDVITRLNAGEDINELAKELSQLPNAKDYGAEMGWITKGQDTGAFDILFDLPLNEISMPIGYDQVETKGGYWVFDVLEKDDSRALTTNQKNMLVDDFLEKFTTELEKDPNFEVEVLLTPEIRDFAINEVVASQGEGSVIISTSSLANGVRGESYSQQLEVYGNKKGNTWSITKGRLPGGLSLDASTGVISGAPETMGGFSFTVEVNSGFYYWAHEYFLRVYGPISVSTDSLRDGQVGVYYSAMLEALGGGTTHTWSVNSGSLPDGLSLVPTGYIYGTPETAGTYNFTIQVDDGSQKAIKTLSLTIVSEATSES